MKLSTKTATWHSQMCFYFIYFILCCCQPSSTISPDFISSFSDRKKKKESHVSCFKTFPTNHKSSRRRMLTKEHIKHAVLYSPLLFFLSLLHLFFVLVECIFMVQFFFFFFLRSSSFHHDTLACNRPYSSERENLRVAFSHC